MNGKADQAEMLVTQSAWASAKGDDCHSALANGGPRDTGPVWTDLSRFQEKLDIFNQLFQRCQGNTMVFSINVGQT